MIGKEGRYWETGDGRGRSASRGGRSVVDRRGHEGLWTASETSQLMLAYLVQKIGKTEPIDPVEVVRTVLPLLISSLPKNVHLKADLPLQGPIIQADGVHINLILSNLVSNAVVDIGERKGHHHRIRVMTVDGIVALRFFPSDWNSKAISCACILVSDTGCGLDAATQEKIFELTPPSSPAADWECPRYRDLLARMEEQAPLRARLVEALPLRSIFTEKGEYRLLGDPWLMIHQPLPVSGVLDSVGIKGYVPD